MADSDPESEFAETMHKARALLRAAAMARGAARRTKGLGGVRVFDEGA